MTQTATSAAPVQNNGQIVKHQLSHSERFTLAIEREFSGENGPVQLTKFQRKLCQNYFIKIDTTLKELEVKRLAKSEKYREPIPYTWENVNLAKLSVDVIAYSGVGLDPTQPNHLNCIPIVPNKNARKYDIVFIVGYKGSEIKARKYGLDIPDDVVVELVYSTDKFQQFKKDMNNKVETYHFEVMDNFNRGEIVGGFYYHKYFDRPEKNKIKVFSKKDIDKRKPSYAAAEFWGGEKDKWEYDQATGKNKKVGTIEVEGWYDEMAYKTIYRAAYNSITIDSEKIDEHYLAVLQKELDNTENAVIREIANNANKNEIGFDEEPPIQQPEEVKEPVAYEHGEMIEDDAPEVNTNNQTQKAPF